MCSACKSNPDYGICFFFNSINIAKALTINSLKKTMLNIKTGGS